MKQLGQSRRQCLFCDRTDLTKEHAFPKWARAFIRNEFPKRVHSFDSIAFDVLDRRMTSSIHRTNRPGDPRFSGIRAVCRTCNGGWMSRLQQRVKPMIVGLNHDERYQLSAEDRQTLSRWAAVTATTFEHRHAHLTCSTKESRSKLRTPDPVSADWSVWIARYEGDRWASFNHFGGPLTLVHRVTGTMHPIPGLGVQSTAWVLAGLYFQAVYSTLHRTALPPGREAAASYEMRKTTMRAKVLWPSDDSPMVVDGPVFSDIEADDESRRALGVTLGQSRRAWE